MTHNNDATAIRGCYLHYRDVTERNPRPTGIDKKVAGHIAAFNHAGLNCEFIQCAQPETLIPTVVSCLPFANDGVNWPSASRIEGLDFMYIRRPRFASRELVAFLRKVKQLNPSIRILYEVPTYPYDGEMESLHMRPAGRKDRMWRTHLHKYVSRIPYLASEEHDTIFGCRGIRISNGIDLSNLQTRRAHAYGHDSLSIISVAMFMPWHGIDRLISGLAAYRRAGGTRNITVHLVGEGEAQPQLMRQAKRAGVDDMIVFHGRMSIDEFDHLYDESDVAIECLANYRKGIHQSSSLKSREYLAKGIPFVYAGEIDTFVNDPVDFCLQVPERDEPLAMEKLIEFCDALYDHESPQALAGRMRAYAQGHISMDATMRPVIDYLLEACNHDQ